MFSRGESHDLAFVEASDPYVSWLTQEIASLEVRIQALEVGTFGCSMTPILDRRLNRLVMLDTARL
jgi:hypothetical protein